MTEPVAWLNGRLVPADSAAVPVTDLGVVAGAGVTEMLRTFQHVPFRRDEHLDRLFESLDLLGFPDVPDRAALEAAIDAVVAHNRTLIPAGHDLGIVVFVTAGQNLTYLGAAGRDRADQGTCCVHSFPLPFELWAAKYSTGQHLATVSVPPLPAAAISPRAKHRNRLHWWRADRAARSAFPDAQAVLTTPDGILTETSSANVLVVRGRTITAAPLDLTLSGISQHVVRELAATLGLAWQHAPLTPADLRTADEVLTSSTPPCLLPVTRFNGQPVGSGTPGPVFRNLIAAWSDLAGLDIVRQATDAAACQPSDDA